MTTRYPGTEHAAWWHFDLPSPLLLKACPNWALHMNAPGKWRTQPHTLQCHIIGYIDTDPFKSALSPPTGKKKRYVHTCMILKLFWAICSWESESSGFSGCKVTSPAPPGDLSTTPERSWAPLAAPRAHTQLAPLAATWQLQPWISPPPNLCSDLGS